MIPWAALAASYALVGTIVAVGEGLRRAGAGLQVSRKFIHVGSGLWALAALWLFPDWTWAAVPPLTAAAGNWAVRRWRLVPAMAEVAGGYGTVYFPLSVAILYAALWRIAPAAIAAGVAAMTVGDPAAAWVGGRWPRWPLAGGRKHLSGSAALFVAVLSVLPGLLTVGFGVPPGQALAAAVVLAAAAVVLEAAGHRGTDNLSVPLGVALLAALLLAEPGAQPGAAGALPAGTAVRLAAAVGLSLAIAAAGYARGALAGSGLLGAVAVGTPVFGLGGLGPGLGLVVFFVSSSLLGRAFAGAKAGAELLYAKGGRRDIGQVLANGGAAAVLAAAGQPVPALGAIAAACADTWATEVGPIWRRPPRLVTTGQAVPPGTSGAVSPPGLVAALAGGLLIGLCALLVPEAGLRGLWAVAAAGLGGSLVDSLLGATVQGQFRCRCCGRVTERMAHCGAAAVRVRGWTWLGNDGVNLAATAAGALLAGLLAG